MRARINQCTKYVNYINIDSHIVKPKKSTPSAIFVRFFRMEVPKVWLKDNEKFLHVKIVDDVTNKISQNLVKKNEQQVWKYNNSITDAKEHKM